MWHLQGNPQRESHLWGSKSFWMRNWKCCRDLSGDEVMMLQRSQEGKLFQCLHGGVVWCFMLYPQESKKRGHFDSCVALIDRTGATCIYYRIIIDTYIYIIIIYKRMSLVLHRRILKLWNQSYDTYDANHDTPLYGGQVRISTQISRLQFSTTFWETSTFGKLYTEMITKRAVLQERGWYWFSTPLNWFLFQVTEWYESLGRQSGSDDVSPRYGEGVGC